MSSRLFQNIIAQMSGDIERVFGVIDNNFVIIACSENSKTGEVVSLPLALSELDHNFDHDFYSYKMIIDSGVNEPEYAVFVEGKDAEAEMLASILSTSFSNLKKYYDEKFDRISFIKNVILDNILPGDIYIKARELHFNSGVNRVALLIRLLKPTDVFVYDILQNLFPDKNKDFIISINEQELVIIKEIKQNTSVSDLEKLGTSIIDTLTNGHNVPAIVSIGSSVNNIKNLARSFKEAQTALEVSKVFDAERNVVNYEKLGIARLIYQLPNTLCEIFLREVFKKGSIEALDAETLFTINKFFENNLNVSETSRKLFVHRNTLVYRLEKIKKITGLDLREFEHAIVFKVAMMVKKYLNVEQGER